MDYCQHCPTGDTFLSRSGQFYLRSCNGEWNKVKARVLFGTHFTIIHLPPLTPYVPQSQYGAYPLCIMQLILLSISLYSHIAIDVCLHLQKMFKNCLSSPFCLSLFRYAIAITGKFAIAMQFSHDIFWKSLQIANLNNHPFAWHGLEESPYNCVFMIEHFQIP